MRPHKWTISYKDSGGFRLTGMLSHRSNLDDVGLRLKCRRKAMKTLLCGLLTVLLCQPAAAYLNGEPRFQHLTVSDGLSQGTVNAIVQDRHGFMWFATQQGLNRYDGIEFRTFHHDAETPGSLPDDWVRDLHVDSKGRLWVSTLDGQLARYDDARERFITHRLDLADVRRIASDADGGFWLAADKDGLGHYLPAENKLLKFTLEQVHAAATLVRTVYCDSYGNLWIGTEGAGLLRYLALTREFQQVQGLPANAAVSALHGGGEGALYIATAEHGLYRLDQLTGELSPWLTSELASSRPRALLLDSSNRLWVGHQTRGLSQAQGDSVINLEHDSGRDNSLLDNHIRALYEDQSGLIWIGTQRGVSLWNPNSNSFVNFRPGELPDQLSASWISNFAEKSPSQFWVSTFGGGVNLVDLQTRNVTHYRQGQDSNSLSDDRVMAVLSHRDGSLWAGGFSGVSVLSEAGTWRHYKHDANDPDSLSHNVVASLLQDRSGRVWVGTQASGLNLYIPESGGFQRFNTANGLCSNQVLSIFEDRQGMLWLGSLRQGLCRFDPATGESTHFGHDPANRNSLSSDSTWLTIEDAQGNLWIGTDGTGLNVWRAEDRLEGRAHFQRLSRKEGLASDVVYGMLVDTLGRLWVGSNLGLTRYEFTHDSAQTPGTHIAKRRHFTVDDGLNGNEFNYAAAFRSSSGRMLFGGTGGFSAFQPEAPDSETTPLPVVLTGFNRVNTAETFDLQAPSFDLGHDDQLVRFEYAALDFAAPHRIQYEHMLEGFDTGWVANRNHNQATYTNLEAGSYVFRVRAAREGEAWSERTLTAQLSVAPAPWATPSAYAAYLLLACLLALYFYRAWMHRLQAAQEIHEMNEALLIEVDQRQARERDLQQAQQKIEQYLAVAEVPILALDSKGAVSMINRKGARILRLREDEALGLNFVNEFVPRDERDRFNEHLNGVTHYQYTEAHLLDREGREKLIAWQMVRLGAEDSPPNGVLLSGSDLTQMRKLEKQLRDGQKMEALGTLARGVAHDFNNILSAILGYTELAAGTLDRDAPGRDYLTRLESSVDRAREIVQSVLLFSRANQLPMELVNFSEVVEDAVQLVRPIVGPNIRLQEKIELEIGPVLANPGQITQILLNLCTNACQSMESSGGELKVAVTDTEITPTQAAELGLIEPGSYAVLEIADTGHGMDEYTRSRVFEPFFTTRSAGQGSGLGLSVVHGVVNQLGGTIQLESEPGQGTHFRILLPCRDEPLPEAAPQTRSVAQTRTATLLFVDDEAELTQVAKLSLEDLGYRVLIAHSGEQALEIISRDPPAIDVLITDQTMPGMRGEDLAKAARKIVPGLPILLISGADTSASPYVSDFIGKPYRKSELAQRIATLLDTVATSP